jgi:hypothetical protein
LPDPLPVDPGGLPTATTAVTLQGGTVDIAIDPATGQQVVLYTPPAGGMCGMDVFMYLPQSSETDPDTGNTVWRLADAVATVSLIRQPQAAGGTTDGVSWAQCPPAACCLPSGLCYDDYTQAECVTGLGGVWYQGFACGDAAVPCTTFGGANPCVDAALQVTYHASINEPPAGGTPPTLPIDPCRLDRTQIDVNAQTGVVSGVSWDNVEATITDGNVTQPEELILRYWFATVPGGPPDEFVDVRPFADPATTVDCGPTVAPPLPLGPSSGSCGIAGARYVPTQNGVTAIPLEFLVQHDLVPGADACWLAGGSFGVFVEDDGGYGAVASTGACCVGGLCIETNPFDCLALAGFTLSEDYWSSDADPSNDPDPDGGERMWKRTAASSGFFMGIGTTCDQRDWCRPTAPCCYDLASGERTCSVLTPDDCWTVGTTLGNADADYGVDWGTIGQEGAFVDATTLDGTPWSDLDEAAWGFGCDWPTCFVEDPAATSIATAACCVRTSDDTFCTDLTEEACAEFGVATGWETSWSVQGSCDQIPCGSFGDVAWGGPLGACCYQYEGGSVNCESDLTFDECMNTYLTPDDPTLIPNYIQFRPGEACGGPSDCDLADPPDELGACCMSASELCCVLDTQRSDCNRMGGTWLGADSDCGGCSQREIEAGVCCLFGMACVESMNNARCVAAGGTWHPTFTSCDAGLPCYGSTGVGFGSGACCFEYQCVDASTPGFSNTTEADCLLAGGKWLGSGACAGFPAGACDPIDCHCVEPHDGTNCDDLFDDYTVYTIDGTTCGRFGGEPSVLLGDVNEDGRVGGLPDLLPLIEDWGGPSANADLDFDGTVGIQDLLILFTEWE